MELHLGLLEKFRGNGHLREVPRITPEVADLRDRLLSQSDLFQGMDRTEMEGIGSRLPMATASRGQMIYTPGETQEALFLLKSGQVRLYRLAADGRKFVLGTIGPGTMFGEMSFIGQSMIGSYAEVTEDATVCVMSRLDIQELMLQHPQIAVRLTQILAERLRDAEDRLEQVAFRSVPARLARLLLRLAGETDTAGGYSHQELADMIGTSRETVSRALVEMKQDSLIDIERRSVRIIDKPGLERHASGENAYMPEDD